MSSPKSYNDNDVEKIVTVVRNWLRTASKRKTIPSGSKIWEHYQDFMRDLPQLANKFQLAVNELVFNDFIFMLTEWLITQPPTD